MTFDQYLADAQAIFDSFPNERVWLQGGIRPNRQLQKPEAGYCIVFRYDEETANTISRHMVKIRSVLPPVVEYNVRNLHTTIGVHDKGEMSEFVLDSAVMKRLGESVAEGLSNCPATPSIKLGRWLFNDEAILVSGYPNHDLWKLMQNVGRACGLNGHPLEMARVTHVTTARFISGASHESFKQLVLLVKSTPFIGSVMPSSVDLATWRCNGLKFELVTHNRYSL